MNPVRLTRRGIIVAALAAAAAFWPLMHLILAATAYLFA